MTKKQREQDEDLKFIGRSLIRVFRSPRDGRQDVAGSLRGIPQALRGGEMTKHKRLITTLHKLAEDEKSLTRDRLKAAELICRVHGIHRA